MPSAFVSLTAGELRTANVANLEGELSALWQSAAEDPETQQAVTRASVLTLLAYVESQEAGAETLDLIAQITPENPCRAIVMIAERAANAAALRASISARCRTPSPGEKQVCCETVSIYASGGAVEGLKSLVVPLIIPELPVYLWWRTDHFAPAEYMADILRVADRVLVDSAGYKDAEKGLADLAQQVRRSWGARRLAFSDLNWSRLTPWRELLAHCFDFPQATDCLRRISRVRIEWIADGSAQPRAGAAPYLLAAWLAGRLGWKPKTTVEKPGSRVFNLEAEGQPVQIICGTAEASQPGPPRASVSVETRGEPAAVFHFRESAGERKIEGRCEVPGRPPFERTVLLQPTRVNNLLGNELRFPSHDTIYEEVLDAFASMIAASN